MSSAVGSYSVGSCIWQIERVAQRVAQRAAPAAKPQGPVPGWQVAVQQDRYLPSSVQGDVGVHASRSPRRPAGTASAADQAGPKRVKGAARWER